MRPTVHVAMLGFPVLAILIFAFVRPRRRGILAIFLLGYMFLPESPGSDYKIPGLPAFTKFLNINLSSLLAVVIVDARRLLSLRPLWVDLPIAVWCLVPMVTSLSNDLGVYDGLSGCVGQILMWGSSYLLGRMYFSRPPALKELAIAVFVGGLVYVPLCLLEVRLSPQLHTWVYGFQPSAFDQSFRFGGWRPVVFMTHGLVVGLFMSMATLAGFWLWLSGAVRTIGRFSILWLLIPLAVTTVLVKSMGALVLLGLGVGIAIAIHRFSQGWILLGVAALPVLYIGLRATGSWSGQELVSASELVSEERGQSLQFRMKNEDLLAEKALRRPFFGWGGWGRSRVYDEEGQDLTITDGLWIIQLGYYGLVGLAGMVGTFIVPLWVMARKIPPRLWVAPSGSPCALLATILALYLMDCLPNATFNPIYLLGAGGLAGLIIVWKTPSGLSSRPPAPTGSFD